MFRWLLRGALIFSIVVAAAYAATFGADIFNNPQHHGAAPLGLFIMFAAPTMAVLVVIRILAKWSESNVRNDN